MSYKTILLHLNDERRARHLLAHGVQVARTFEAHLIGLHVFPSGMLSTPGPMRLPAEIVGSIKKRIREESERINSAFNDLTANQPFVAEWRNITSERGDPEAIVASHGRTADLILASQSDPTWDMSALLDFPERLALASGRPVLMVPNGDRPATFPKTIVVAWNGSRESARAVFDALPFLQRATSVTVLTVDESHTASGTALPDVELAASLARHGVKLTVSKLKPGKHSTGETIRQTALDLGADLMVLGAFGRSRLFEFTFGGVTRHLSKTATIPVLFSH
jgi:nucleotide-binding universal stress UspA family protein